MSILSAPKPSLLSERKRPEKRHVSQALVQPMNHLVEPVAHRHHAARAVDDERAAQALLGDEMELARLLRDPSCTFHDAIS